MTTHPYLTSVFNPHRMATHMSNITLFDNPLSGHAHRPRALLKLLGLEFKTVIIDFASGEHKGAEYLAINPLGQLPALTDGKDVTLRDSTAILVYLALKYDTNRTWLPVDPAAAAEVQAWLATSTKEVYDGPCAARLSKLFGAPFDHAAAVAKADTLFKTLFEPRLAENDWLVGNSPTIADISNYGYIAAAHEGEIDINQYPHTAAWIKRLESLDHFEAIPKAADILGGA